MNELWMALHGHPNVPEDLKDRYQQVLKKDEETVSGLVPDKNNVDEKSAALGFFGTTFWAGPIGVELFIDIVYTTGCILWPGEDLAVLATIAEWADDHVAQLNSKGEQRFYLFDLWPSLRDMLFQKLGKPTELEGIV